MSLRFTNLLKDLIVENSRFQVLYDKFVKPKDKTKKGILPFETLLALIAADPTSSFPEGMDIDNATPDQMDRVKIGKYTQWLLKNFITPKLEPNHPLNVLDPQSSQYKSSLKEFQDLFMEDLYKVTGDLQKFERFKNRLPQEFRDINKLTPDTLYDNVKDFSLEKTKATKDEKKVASKTYEHPGADVVYRGQDWTVAKIEDKGQLGKDAACFYGGSYQETGKGETRWCTSSPGLTWFDRYIKDGPLYVVIPNTGKKHSGEKEYGDVSGLPALRYQFHFPSNQFMDPSDRQINLIDFLNTNEEGLKQFFKPEFMKSLSGDKGTKVQVEYPNDSASKFIALYGFDEFFESLPENLERFTFKNSSRDGKFALNIPEDIGRFKSLTALNLVGCVASIPESICTLPNLQYLSLPDNPDLQKLPECIGNMENLMVLNIPGGGGKGVIPQSVYDRAERDEDFHIFE
jgi:Leucine-rich repeat (LRR) protein